jgi:lipopolysaccharide/colanic/teichoic acid biosynthesis glycosyltransferase
VSGGRRRFPQSFVAIGSIFVAVTAVAIAVEDQPPGRVALLGLVAALIAAVLAPLDRDSGWKRHGAASPTTLMALALVLSAAHETFGFGLSPGGAIVAAIGAGVAGIVVSAAGPRRLVSRPPRRVLIVGSGAVADAIGAGFREGGLGEVVGCLDDDDGDGVLGRLDDLDRVAREQRIDMVAFAYSRANDERLARVASRCRELDLAIAVVPRLFEQFDMRTRLRRIDGVPLLVVDPLPHQVRSPLLSRIFDVVVAGALLVLTLPLWIVIAIAVLIDEPGPVLYRARRVGRHGREFDMYKFRKMRRDAAGGKLTLVDDDRFTRIGRLLTRTKLDELPQLVNVLRGEMALVGPRPEDPMYVRIYPRQFAEIHLCRPGITGLSQIQYRDEAPLLVGDDFEELYRNDLLPKKIDLDRYYATRRCLALDLRILGWTLVAIFAGAHVHRHELTRSLRFQRAGAIGEDAEDGAARVLEVA